MAEPLSTPRHPSAIAAQRAGFSEDEIFPPGSPLPPLYLTHAMALDQQQVIIADRLSPSCSMSRSTPRSNRARPAGYERSDEAEELNTDAAADLLGL